LSVRVRRGAGRGDLKEEAILRTAERLLSEKPFREIGVAELARGAGISRPTFYFYFDSKNAVLSALVARITDKMYRASYAWAENEGEDSVESTRRSIAAAASLWREHGPFLRAAVQTWGSVPEMRRFWEDAVSRFVEASAEQIERARTEAGATDGGPSPRALATALIWMNERCFYTNSIGASPSLSDEELVDTLTAIWVRAVHGVEPPAPPGA
jgi:AcrR family transcriptional regulator